MVYFILTTYMEVGDRAGWVAETQLKLRFSELTRLIPEVFPLQFEISHLKSFD